MCVCPKSNGLHRAGRSKFYSRHSELRHTRRGQRIMYSRPADTSFDLYPLSYNIYYYNQIAFIKHNTYVICIIHAHEVLSYTRETGT